ncbi:MAG: hypothetical protein MUE81_21635 [Thermoflexibacter sp.]|jgi:WD40 repeat protein|nr:hypothetical protein [Thermoflexibacter sp.]
MKSTSSFPFAVLLFPLRGLGGFLLRSLGGFLLFTFLLSCTLGLAQKPELRVQIGHTGAVNQIVPLPDGKSFLSAGNDGVIIHWDTKSGREIRRFQGDVEHFIQNFYLLSNGSGFLTKGWRSKFIKYWDLNTGKLIKVFDIPTTELSQISLLPDNKSFLVQIMEFPYRIEHWNILSGHKIRIVEEGYGNFRNFYSDIIALPDNKSYLILNRNEKGQKEILHKNLVNGETILLFKDTTSPIEKIILVLNDNTFLTKSRDKNLKRWDLTNGRQLEVLEEHKLKIRNLISNEEIIDFKGGSESIKQIILLLDNKYLIVSTSI